MNFKNIHIVFILSALAFFFGFAYQNLQCLIIGCIISLAVALIILRRIIFTPELRYNFFLLGGVIVLLWTSLGTFNIWFNYFHLDYNKFTEYLIINDIKPAYLNLAHLYTNFFVIITLFAASKFTSKSKKINEIILNGLKYKDQAIWIFSITFGQIYYFITGYVGFQGTTIRTFTDAPLLALLTSLCPGVLLLLGYRFNKFKEEKLLNKLVFILLIIIQLGWFFSFGRRSIVFATIVFLIGFYHNKIPKFNVKNVIGIALLLFCLSYSTKLFFSLRTVINTSGERSFTINDLDWVLEEYSQASSKVIEVKYTENIATRSFITPTFARLIDKMYNEDDSHFALGESLISEILRASPGSFLIDKTRLISAERLYPVYVPSYYEGNVYDTLSTVYLDAYLDFEVIGFFFIVVLLYILVKLGLSLARKGNKTLFILFIGDLIFLFLNLGEASTSTFILSFRNFFFLLALFYFLNSSRRIYKPAIYK